METSEKRVAAFVALGANLDSPVDQLQSAVRAIADCDGISIRRASSLYSTDPMGPADQPAYVNAVCELKTSLDALQLLDALQAIELSHGRIRQGKRWGPRTLDLDILLYGDNVINEDRLEIPHPGITLRSFVLIPLLEIAPKIEIPKLGHAAAYRESVEMYGIVKMDVPLET